MDASIDLILDDLAAGRIDTAEAARRIDAARAQDPSAEPAEPAEPAESTEPMTDAPETPQAPPSWADIARGLAGAAGLLADSAQQAVHAVLQETAEDPVTTAAQTDAPRTEPTETPRRAAEAPRLVVRATARRVRIIADPQVADVRITGEHQLRRSSERIEVTSLAGGHHLEPTRLLGPLIGLRTARTLDEVRDGLGRTASGLGASRELEIRVNPSMVVDADITTGSLQVTGVPQLGRIRLTGGSLEVTGVQSIQDALVQAANAVVTGAFTGRSRINVETGSLTLRLAEGSDLTLSGAAQLGRISWPTGSDQISEYVVGQGSGRMELGATMATITVTVTN